MKNIILATTALVATAGVAAADVSISGYGRFGATYTDGAAAGATAAADADAVQAAKAALNAATTAADAKAAAKALAAAEKAAAASKAIDDGWSSASRLRLQFDVSAETDSGIVFGARQRIQTEENGGGATGNGARFYMTTNGFTLAMGNILGVVEAAPNLYMPTASAGVGLEGNGFYSLAANTTSNGGYFGWTAYSSGGDGATDGVELLYNMNGFGAHLHSTDESTGLGLNYTFSGYTVAAAYEDFDNGDSVLFASVGGTIGQFDVALAYADTEFGGEGADKISLKGAYDMGNGLTVYGFVANEDNDAGDPAGESYGIGASYDLGGGVSVEGGITKAPDDAVGRDQTIASFGAFFKF